MHVSPSNWHWPLRVIAIGTLGALTLVGSAPAGTLISQPFGSGSGPLNETVPLIFDTAIADAGGSNMWEAKDVYEVDGTLAPTGTGDDGAAFLNLGTFITGAAGSADALFTIQASFTTITGGDSDSGTWISFGFFDGSQSTSVPFFSGNHGLATAVLRRVDGGSNDYFAGLGATGGENPAEFTGDTTFKIVLDLTPAGGWNGTTNFGTAYFYRNGGGSPEADFTYSSAATSSFKQVGFSHNDSANTTISSFTLSQIPEPGTVLLLALGAGVMALVRRARPLK